MFWWRPKADHPAAAAFSETRLRHKYATFRRLLSLNNECLELMASLQEDLQFISPRWEVVADRVVAIFENAQGIASELSTLAGKREPALMRALDEQRQAIETYLAAQQEKDMPRLAASLSDVAAGNAMEVGGKAAALGEIKNRLGLPVPEGFVLTTEAYRQFCGIPLWSSVRDALHDSDPSDLDGLQAISARLTDMVMDAPLPRAIEVAISERVRLMEKGELGLAVRSSAVGEGGEHTFAGQFLSLINVPPEEALDAYRRVVAGRFSEKSLSYRLSTGLTEIESPMAALFLPVVEARASGILYTRDPRDPKRPVCWVTSTCGLGLDIASGQVTPDLFVVSREPPYDLVESQISPKEKAIVSPISWPMNNMGIPLVRSVKAPSALDI